MFSLLDYLKSIPHPARFVNRFFLPEPGFSRIFLPEQEYPA